MGMGIAPQQLNMQPSIRERSLWVSFCSLRGKHEAGTQASVEYLQNAKVVTLQEQARRL
jgi:hypothetical protein